MTIQSSQLRESAALLGMQNPVSYTHLDVYKRQLHGLHHVTAVTGNAPGNLEFYTRVLGLRLVKKTVNQDDTSAYHLFYSDTKGTPGLDMTFFDWPRTGPDQRGTDSIANTLFRVNGRAALDYWVGRFQAVSYTHLDVYKRQPPISRHASSITNAQPTGATGV